jgi:hypothetical protein
VPLLGMAFLLAGGAIDTLWHNLFGNERPRSLPVVQVALILSGHALSVLAAHDRAALAESPGRPPPAVLADELPVVLFMIACTRTGLFLLFVR